MKQASETGQLGENLACEFLVNKGYRVLGRNYRRPWGELDVIAKAKDGTLVFVEVKTIRQSNNSAIAGLEPEDHLTTGKLEKLRRMGQMFANKNPGLVNEKRGWQIDLVAIVLIEGAEPTIRRYENI